MQNTRSRKNNKTPNKFVETARELGLDNEESAAAFERAFGKIAPPKKRPDRADRKDKDDTQK